MDMLELITMIQEQRERPIIYSVWLEELPPIQVWVDSPEDRYYYKPPKLTHETKFFHNKEELVCFLFDKDIFGWEVKEWNITDFVMNATEMTIKLYRFNCR